MVEEKDKDIHSEHRDEIDEVKEEEGQLEKEEKVE